MGNFRKFFSSLTIILMSFVIGCLVTILVQSQIQFFFTAMWAGVITGVIVGGLFWLLFTRVSKKQTVSKFDAVYVATISGLLLYGFLTSVPLNLDRSFTVWSLNQLYKSSLSGEKLNVSDMKIELSQYFSPESGEIDRRVKEQILVGNLSVSSNGDVTLTEQGKRQRNFFAFMGKIFSLTPKYTQ